MHAVWDREVAGSNPVFPTINETKMLESIFFICNEGKLNNWRIIIWKEVKRLDLFSSHLNESEVIIMKFKFEFKFNYKLIIILLLLIIIIIINNYKKQTQFHCI